MSTHAILSRIAAEQGWTLVERPTCWEIPLEEDTLKVFPSQGRRPGFLSVKLMNQEDILPDQYSFFARAQLARVKYHSSRLVLQEKQICIVQTLPDCDDFILYDIIERLLNEVDFWKVNLNH